MNTDTGSGTKTSPPIPDFRRRRRARALPAFILFALGACEGQVTSIEIASVDLNPGQAHLSAIDDTVRLTARAMDAEGNQIANASFAWSSSMVEVATVDGSGLVTAVGNGKTNITVDADGISKSAEVTVSQMVATIAVTPSSHSFSFLGDTVRLAPELADGNGHAMSGVTASWSSSATSVATVDEDGLVTATGDGTTTITAEADGIQGSVSISVDQLATTLSITPTSAALVALEDTVRLSASGTDSGGSPVDVLAVTWSSSAPGVAEVDGEGLVEAMGNGTAEITAEADGSSASIEVTVRQEVASVGVVPSSLDVIVTDTSVVSVTPRDANGFAVADATIQLTSDAPEIADIDPVGRIAALSRGNATISVSAEGVTTPLEVGVSGTVVGGTLASDTTWRVAGSPFVLTAHVLVPMSVSLVVDPGVEVLFRSGTSIVVDGTFTAIGTSLMGIGFTAYDDASPEPGEWGVIRFNDTSVDAVLDLGGNYVSGSGIAFAEISYGQSVQFHHSSPFFEFNHVHHLAGGSPTGWPSGAVWACESASPVRFSVIEDNQASGVVSLGGPMSIEDNQIGRNEAQWGGGIFVGGSDCGVGSGTVGAPVIELNVISENRAATGGGIHVGSMDARIAANRIWDNVTTDTVTQSGGGAAISVADASPDILDNELDGNRGPAGAPSTAILLRNEFGGVIRNNNLVNQTTYEIFLIAVTSGSAIDATANWWGTTDLGIIQGSIWDFDDDIDLIPVEYDPVATSPVAIPGCRCS